MEQNSWHSRVTGGGGHLVPPVFVLAQEEVPRDHLADGFLQRYTHDWYQNFLGNWEIELRHYLSSGTEPPE